VDPNGVNDIPDAANEYDGYIGRIYEFLEQGVPESTLYSYLRDIEVDRMGLCDEAREPFIAERKRRAVVSSLIDLRGYFAKPS